jgi:hypothetical protein
VIEHLTEREQITYLRRAWSLIEPGQMLIIIETPNLLSLYDDHTFEASFAHLVPDEIIVEWMEQRPPRSRFREILLDSAKSAPKDEVLLKRRRLGMGVTPQTF